MTFVDEIINLGCSKICRKSSKNTKDDKFTCAPSIHTYKQFEQEIYIINIFYEDYNAKGMSVRLPLIYLYIPCIY
jgi:hypothetical protein